jgi:hypothetical protein
MGHFRRGKGESRHGILSPYLPPSARDSLAGRAAIERWAALKGIGRHRGRPESERTAMDALRFVKLLHTVIWAFFVGCPSSERIRSKIQRLKARLFRRSGWLLQGTADSVNLRGHAPALLPDHHSRCQSASGGSPVAVLARSREHRLEAASRRREEEAASAATGQCGPGLLGSHEMCLEQLDATALDPRAGHRREVAPRALSAPLDPSVATEARPRPAGSRTSCRSFFSWSSFAKEGVGA